MPPKAYMGPVYSVKKYLLYLLPPKSNLFLEVFRNLVGGDKNFVKLQHAEKRFELGERDLLRA